MNVLAVLLGSATVFYVGYRFYARFIESVFDVDGSRPSPAVKINDGVDYVPSRPFVVFGHHFASIAGAGPIIGPTVALVYGYVPVWLWIVVGTLFIGAVHDFSALLASMRENGRSVAEIAKKTLGQGGFLLFIGFTVIMMVTTIAALGIVLMNDYIPQKNLMLAAGDILLIALALGVIGLAVNMAGRRETKN